MRTLLTIIFIFHGSFVLSAETPKKSAVEGGIVINDSLKKLMDVDGVSPIFKSCESTHTGSKGSDDYTEKVLDCLWRTVQGNPDLTKKIQKIYAEELKGEKAADASKGKDAQASRAPASSDMKMTARNTSVGIDYQSDPTVAALSDFFGKKLSEILNPEKALTEEERKNGMILSVDHRQFVDLYKSELGKTIVSSFTSYCIDVDPTTCPQCTISKDEKTRERQRKENIESLKKANLTKEGDDNAKWLKCISSVGPTCNDAAAKSPQSMSESEKRACLIVDYVKAARKNIMVVDEQKKFYDELNKEHTTNIVGNARMVEDMKKNSSDAVLEMTSKDVKTALEKPLEKNLKELEGCYNGKEITNIEACKKYLDTNRDANVKGLAELGMRQIAQEAILTEELNSSPDKVRDYLKEEGYSEKEVATMTADPKDIEQIKKEILDRYKNQKAAIIKEMSKKIESKTASKNGAVDAKLDTAKMAKIQEEIKQRSDDLQNLVFFNNIVSSYLETTDTNTKKVDRNTASLFAEVNSMEEKEAKVLKENIEKAKLTDQKGNASTTDLDVNAINSQLLNYSTQKADSASKKAP